MEFVIDRTKWRCGGNNGFTTVNERGLGDTFLLNDEGYMCCLGHVALQCGLLREEISGHSDYGDFISDSAEKDSLSKLTTCLLAHGEDQDTKSLLDELQVTAIAINDDPKLSEEEREAELIEHFAKHGHTMRFEGEYVKSAPVSDGGQSA